MDRWNGKIDQRQTIIILEEAVAAMITLLLELHGVNREDILQLISQLGCEIKLESSIPKIADGIEFRGFTCRKGPAFAAGDFMEPQAKPGTMLVGLSVSILRLWKFWRIPADRRLVWGIRDALISHGATLVEDD